MRKVGYYVCGRRSIICVGGLKKDKKFRKFPRIAFFSSRKFPRQKILATALNLSTGTVLNNMTGRNDAKNAFKLVK